MWSLLSVSHFNLLFKKTCNWPKLITVDQLEQRKCQSFDPRTSCKGGNSKWSTHEVPTSKAVNQLVVLGRLQVEMERREELLWLEEGASWGDFLLIVLISHYAFQEELKSRLLWESNFQTMLLWESVVILCIFNDIWLVFAQFPSLLGYFYFYFCVYFWTMRIILSNCRV